MKAKCIKPLCVDGYRFEEGKEYDKAGFVCAAPSVSQIRDFCEKMGMEIVIETRIDGCRAVCYDKQKVLKELIREYRRRTGFTDAFRRYAHDI